MTRHYFILSFFLLLFFISGCSHFFQSQDIYQEKAQKKGVDEAYRQLSEAEQAYANGVIHNMKQEWDKAQQNFDTALEIISLIDVDEERDPHLVGKIDQLLREIAYDYQITLLSNRDLVGSSAPAILSLALEEKALSKSTHRQLDKLISQLPSDQKVDYDIPIVWNDKVKEKVIFFQTDCHIPFQRWLTASGTYLELIQKIFKEEGLPLDLTYLPLVESGFDPNAYSWAHAVGLWQFIKSTGRMFGMEVSWWRDERRDPIKATYSAAKYLKSLYKKFNNWELALAAYNCGEGRVQREIKKQGTENYWELDLPRQTENYVPLFMAAVIIAKNPERYGFLPEYAPPLDYETIVVQEVTNLKLVAECTDTSFEFIQSINPEILRWCTPPNIPNYPIRVPRGKADGFYPRYSQIPEDKKTGWVQHVVKKGETLSEIGMRYRTSVQAIVDANQLRNINKLSIGQNLLIPIQPSQYKDYAQSSSSLSSSSSTVNSSISYNGIYTVKKNDTLSEIAQTHGISVRELSKANGLAANGTIYPGQQLRVPGTASYSSNSYTVRKGDTPSGIASKCGISLAQLLTLNSLNNNSRIYPGQELKIKTGSNSSSPSSPASPSEIPVVIQYTVKPGDTPSHIAERNNMSLSEFLSLNKLQGNATIYPGQEVFIQPGTSSIKDAADVKAIPTKYTVKAGDTPSQIAEKHGLTLSNLLSYNKLNNNSRIFPGQELSLVEPSQNMVTQIQPVTKYSVRVGDTPSQIAERYGISIDELLSVNNLDASSLIYPGQQLIVNSTSQPLITEPKGKLTYVVKSGETLWSIAGKYKVTVSDLKRWNNIYSNDHVLQPGDHLTVLADVHEESPGFQDKTVYTVKSGDSMYKIANSYGVTIADLKSWNGKSNDRLQIGEQLTIYTAASPSLVLNNKKKSVYVVRSGDTLWGIANLHNMTTEELVELNSISNPKSLRIGSRLTVYTP
ncbi:LysM peptidoglycan-binding domain-containing protein [bacterium]|nr:LysM peptidoglycan-binding domain-containing protein [bacterium]